MDKKNRPEVDYHDPHKANSFQDDFEREAGVVVRSATRSSRKKKPREGMVKGITERSGRFTPRAQIARTFEHHLFKLLPANRLQNHSYTHGDPKLENVEHVHFYHSHDRKGNRMVKCAPAGGHFHRIEVDWDKTVAFEYWDAGQEVYVQYEGPKVHVGPAMKEFSRINRAGKEEKFYASEKFFDETKDDDEQPIDNHTHVGIFVRSEIISQDRYNQRVEEDRARLNKMHALEQSSIAAHKAATAPEPPGATPLPLNPRPAM